MEKNNELPENIQELVNNGNVTYSVGKEGVLLKVWGKNLELPITDEKFEELGGIHKIFHASKFIR